MLKFWFENLPRQWLKFWFDRVKKLEFFVLIGWRRSWFRLSISPQGSALRGVKSFAKLCRWPTLLDKKTWEKVNFNFKFSWSWRKEKKHLFFRFSRFSSAWRIDFRSFVGFRKQCRIFLESSKGNKIRSERSFSLRKKKRKFFLKLQSNLMYWRRSFDKRSCRSDSSITFSTCRQRSSSSCWWILARHCS